MMRKKETENEARQITIYILDNWRKVCPNARQMWIDLAETVGFYPYLEKYKNYLILESTASIIRKGYFKSDNLNNIFFHDEQKEILNKIWFGRNLIISAPTSFGKSLLIEEIVSSKKFRNIVVIQPTLALLDETRKKLQKYSESYKIIVKTTQPYSRNKGNIFLLTAERVLEYQNMPNIDFFVLDEFYKLSAKRDDERSDILNNAIYLLLKRYGCSFMFLGPNVEKISNGFDKAYNAEFFKTSYSLVANEEVDCYSGREFGIRGAKKQNKENALFDLLYSLKDEQTLVFCSSPAKVRNLSKQYARYLYSYDNEQLEKYDIPLIEWIEKNVNRDWSLKECLENRIGIHDGALPRHITTSIIDYFNRTTLNCLFCTTTIIEGVNTSAKNIIYFDNKKGKDTPIDYFDYSNIKGRAGRMMVHFVGKIYNFNPPPRKEDIIVDIPFYEQNPVTDEVLINLQLDEVKEPNSEQYQFISGLPDEAKTIIQKNGVNVRGQVNIIDELMWQPSLALINWTGYPRYPQLQYILSLAWKYLLKAGETTRPMTCNKLVKLTFDYGTNKSLSSLIMENYKYYLGQPEYSTMTKRDILDEAIKDAFQVLRHWFEYKVPKWLSVINSLQEYVCRKRGAIPGSYLYYANLIENNFLRPNLTLLLEYNIPVSAIRKMEPFLPESIGEDNILQYIKEQRIADKCELIRYERDFFD